MGKRYHSRTIYCSEDSCKECAHYSFSSQKEKNDHYNKVKKWTCNRHSYPEEVLGIGNKVIIVEQMANKSERYPDLEGLFWNKCKSGFTYGAGFKAYADDFPQGTILRVTAEIILPDN